MVVVVAQQHALCSESGMMFGFDVVQQHAQLSGIREHIDVMK